MTRDCLPPHARSLPVMCGERAPCHKCQSEIESLRGLLETTRRDLAASRREVLYLRAGSAEARTNVAMVEFEIGCILDRMRLA